MAAVIAAPLTSCALVVATVGAASPASATTQAVDVPADRAEPTATGLYVGYGDLVVVVATGTARYGTDHRVCGVQDAAPLTDPDGSRTADAVNAVACAPKTDRRAALPSAAIGQLLAAVACYGTGTVHWQALGSFAVFVNRTCPGQLVFAYNDTGYADNSGGYHVTAYDPFR